MCIVLNSYTIKEEHNQIIRHTFSIWYRLDEVGRCMFLEDMVHTSLHSQKISWSDVLTWKDTVCTVESIYMSDSLSLGCCPLTHSCTQNEHSSSPQRKPWEHSQTVSPLAEHFTFSRIKPVGKQWREPNIITTMNYAYIKTLCPSLTDRKKCFYTLKKILQKIL